VTMNQNAISTVSDSLRFEALFLQTHKNRLESKKTYFIVI